MFGVYNGLVEYVVDNEVIDALVGFFELELVVEALKVTVTTLVVVESFTGVVVLVAVIYEALSERCGSRHVEISHLRSNSSSFMGYCSHFLR